MARIEAARRIELYFLRCFIYVQSVGLQMVMLSTPVLAPAVVLITYAETSDEPLEASTAFTVIMLFMVLRMPFQQFQMTLNQVIMLQVAVDRISQFFCKAELPSNIVDRDSTPPGTIEIAAAFRWSAPTEERMNFGSPLTSSTGLSIRRGLANRGLIGDVEAMGYGSRTGNNIRNTLAATGIIPDANSLRDEIELAEGTQQAAEPQEGPSSKIGPEAVADSSSVTGEQGSGSGVGDAQCSDVGSSRGNGRGADAAGEEATGVQIKVEETPLPEAVPSPSDEPTKKIEPQLLIEDVHVRPGELLGVVGAVGSGKSSFLAAMLGDMLKGKDMGVAKVGGTISYAAQEPFILNATVQDNITFGHPYDEEKFREILRVCALEADLQILTGGQFCMIGEKGITLSGGQKARVALARALYADSDIVLLDDPLSAVDSHVGRHIFEECIMGYLKGRTRVLVTNQVQYLSPDSERPTGTCDHILLFEGCRQTGFATYQQLINSSEAFGGMVAACSAKDDASVASSPSRKRKAAADEKDEKQDAKQNENKKEHRVDGTVGLANYISYMRAAGFGWCVAAFVMFLLTDALRMVAEFTVANWTKEKDKGFTTLTGVYLAFILGSLVCTAIRSILLATCNINASATIHSRLTESVLRAKMSFFDTTQLGAILNRFSSDMERIDSQIRMHLFQTLTTGTQVLMAMATISVATKGIALGGIIPLLIFYLMLNGFFRKTNTELQRLESTTRSPIFALFSESLGGMTTIRAFNDTERFISMAEATIDVNLITVLVQRSSRAWLTMRLEVIGSTLAFMVAVLGITTDFIEPSVMGLALAYSLELTNFLKMFTQMSAELEAKMTSVERVEEYSTELPQEPPLVIEGSRPSDGWPSHGAIEFTDASMRYRDGLNLVLGNGKKLDLSIQPGHRVGIVGRTGAGKSSMLVALFRLAELETGSLTIDGEDVGKFGVGDLRNGLTIIPQDPFLLSGSVRYNLDPMDESENDDDDLWRVLEVVQLKETVEGMKHGLDAEITEGGSNLSVGQRALLCMARALLRKPKILAMDEATAAVDFATDALIQKAIREQMQGCTVLTIAHRLNTILDYDRVLVLDKGAVLEYGSPVELLQNPEGEFHSLVSEANIDIPHTVDALLRGKYAEELEELIQKERADALARVGKGKGGKGKGKGKGNGGKGEGQSDTSGMHYDGKGEDKSKGKGKGGDDSDSSSLRDDAGKKAGKARGKGEGQSGGRGDAATSSAPTEPEAVEREAELCEFHPVELV